ncbi:hypothetical protein Leryth_019354 [Lithospermum erythrorhizon]|nr:hypothetical protein Leryth_019354 [Lithospermum erythrorhizon]
MGAGGRMPVPSKGKKAKSEVFERVPSEKPPFTVGDIKKAIPPHCFQRSVLHSFSYLLYDLVIASIFYYAASHYIHLLPPSLSYVAWPVYWFCQGAVLTGVWVIAHECGHHAFSDYQWLDDTVGLVFVPKKKSGNQRGSSGKASNPPGRVLILLVQLTLGWPLYLMFNVSGRPYDRFACHFDPKSPIY